MEISDLEVHDGLKLQTQGQEVLSPLMRAKKRATKGQKVNACPFGCGVDALDDQGYCRHLIGFTIDTKSYEPMVLDRKSGRRVVKVKREKTELINPEIEKAEGDEAAPKEYIYGPPQLEEVLPTDQLVRITSTYRVYRDVDKTKPKKPETMPVSGRPAQGVKP